VNRFLEALSSKPSPGVCFIILASLFLQHEENDCPELDKKRLLINTSKPWRGIDRELDFLWEKEFIEMYSAKSENLKHSTDLYRITTKGINFYEELLRRDDTQRSVHIQKAYKEIVEKLKTKEQSSHRRYL